MACLDCVGCRVAVCSPGKYGQNCDILCSVNCRSLPCDSCLCEICNQTSGLCTNGCDAGWYGVNCESVCPTNCGVATGLAQSCDRITGNCTSGCQRGFYGDQCNITCSSYCTDSWCDQANGTCLNGCVDGHTADICGGSSSGGGDNGDEIAGAIGGAFVVVLWAVVVIILICFIWKRRLKDIAVFNRNTDLATGSNRSSERRLHKQNSCSSRGSGAGEYYIIEEMDPNFEQHHHHHGTRHSRRSRSLYKKRSMTMDNERLRVPCMCHHTGSHEYFMINDDVIGQEVRGHHEQCVQNEYHVHFSNGKRDLPRRSCSESDIAESITTWRTEQ